MCGAEAHTLTQPQCRMWGISCKNTT